MKIHTLNIITSMHRLWIALAAMGWAAAGHGQNISLNAPQRVRLKELVASDPEAGQYFQTLQRAADAALGTQPNPVPEIQSEGKLANDPAKVRTRESLTDLPKMTALAYAYAITEKPAYLQKATDFLTAWANVNHSTGDPIDDTKLEDAIVAFDLVQQQMPTGEKQAVERWLRQVAEAEVQRGGVAVHDYGNWNSHRLKIIGLIGFAMNDQKFINAAVEGFKRQIGENLKPDGSSLDFHKRDALHYHLYDLEPLLALAIAAQKNGMSLYSYSARGTSLPKSVAFLFPFCEGKQVHREFVNSTVKFDQTRAKAGESEYQAGHPWNPKNAARTLTLNAYFEKDKSYEELKAIGLTFTNYPNWEAVVQEVPAAPPAREQHWKTWDGREFSAVFVRVDNDTVVFQVNQMNYPIPFARLSPESQALVKKLASNENRARAENPATLPAQSDTEKEKIAKPGQGATPTGADGGGNLVLNGDFTKANANGMAENWTLGRKGVSGVTNERGSSYFHFVDPDGTWQFFSQTVDRPLAANEVVVKFRMRAPELKGSSAYGIAIWQLDAQDQKITFERPVQVSGPVPEWTTYTATVKLLPETKKIQLRGFMDSGLTGAVDYGDFRGEVH